MELRTQMQTLTRMDKVVIEDLSPYANNEWKCELDETNTFIGKNSLKPRAPFCTFKLTSTFLIALGASMVTWTKKMLRYTKTIFFLVKGLKVVAKRCLD